ncbi:hypothetical protein GALMADRAFT_214581 [Galerina marginata CBS 339.88]|uniref:Uncharacterized protein n=1 Tax=Galerina marginata (strain CBS 339.88) TaxID=685588 RepID=A0A067SGS2_GALM3|nr:hypothetical protein GALMADRAFT_214581 [Galerina marginata CBS 339.88]
MSLRRFVSPPLVPQIRRSSCDRVDVPRRKATATELRIPRVARESGSSLSSETDRFSSHPSRLLWLWAWARVRARCEGRGRGSRVKKEEVAAWLFELKLDWDLGAEFSTDTDRGPAAGGGAICRLLATPTTDTDDDDDGTVFVLVPAAGLEAPARETPTLLELMGATFAPAADVEADLGSTPDDAENRWARARVRVRVGVALGLGLIFGGRIQTTSTCISIRVSIFAPISMPMSMSTSISRAACPFADFRPGSMAIPAEEVRAADDGAGGMTNSTFKNGSGRSEAVEEEDARGSRQVGMEGVAVDDAVVDVDVRGAVVVEADVLEVVIGLRAGAVVADVKIERMYRRRPGRNARMRLIDVQPGVHPPCESELDPLEPKREAGAGPRGTFARHSIRRSGSTTANTANARTGTSAISILQSRRVGVLDVGSVPGLGLGFGFGPRMRGRVVVVVVVQHRKVDYFSFRRGCKAGLRFEAGTCVACRQLPKRVRCPVCMRGDEQQNGAPGA